METDNIGVLRRYLDAVNRRDADGMVACLEPDAEFIPIMAALEGRVYRGQAGVRLWLAEIEEHWERFETCPEDFEDLGDCVLGFGRWRACGRASGAEIDGQPATWLARMRNGLISWQRTYTDRAEALAAAGVTEEELVARPAADRGQADTRNTEIVRGQLDAVNRRDAEGMVGLMHSECEFVPIMAALEGRIYRGEAGIRQWLDEMGEHWEYFETCPEEFHDLPGDRVIAFGHWRARGRASGVEIDGQPATWTAYIEEGKITKWRTFTNRAEALEAGFVTEAELASLGTER